MLEFDVFNGDADGICSLRQLRLAEPADSVLVTGVKHDIELLGRVEARPGDRVNVLDLSLERNRPALSRLLAGGSRVRFFDHHFAGERPEHPNLELVIDESPDACTGILVDRYLGGRYRAWAVVAAFGDNLAHAARSLAEALGLDTPALEALRDLGANLNYNAYGDTERDVLVPPTEVYRIASRYDDPLKLISEEPLIERIGELRRSDFARVSALAPTHTWAGADAWVLPDASWSRRVNGTFANALAVRDARRAHAVLTRRPDGSCTVSVRTPERGPRASDFCRRFPTGGGRARAAGIGRLEPEGVQPFLEDFARTYERAS
jgi:hypothetical protein